MTGITRRDYGYINATIYGAPYPLTTGRLQSNNLTEGALHLIQRFSNYTRCLADVEISAEMSTEPDLVFKRIGFISLDNLIEWVNTNCPNDGIANFTMACKINIYDEIDSIIAPIRKIYGKNTRRGSLSRTGRYYSSAGYATVDPGTNFSHAATFLDSIWTELFGASLNPGGPGAWTDEDFQCFWFSGNRNTFYTCPSPSRVGVLLNAVGSNFRFMKRNSDGARVAATPTIWDMTSGSYSVKLVSNTKEGSSVDFHQIGSDGGTILTEWASHYTMTIAYPLEDSSSNQSVLLKPLGVDSFYFNYFDDSEYRLEMVSSRGPQTSWHRLLTIDTTGVQRHPEGNSYGPIEIGQMIHLVASPPHFSHRRYRPADMYFHLRSLRTGRVSPISPQYVEWTTHRGVATIAPLVRVRPRT